MAEVQTMMIDKMLCWFKLCRRCKVLSTDEGIGGQCINCGRVHGWVTREQLRAYTDKVIAAEYGELPEGER